MPRPTGWLRVVESWWPSVGEKQEVLSYPHANPTDGRSKMAQVELSEQDRQQSLSIQGKHCGGPHETRDRYHNLSLAFPSIGRHNQTTAARCNGDGRVIGIEHRQHTLDGVAKRTRRETDGVLGFGSCFVPPVGE